MPKEMVSRVMNVVGELASDPYPRGVKKLSGSENTYRIREGSYRVIYRIAKSSGLIEIVKIGHRKDVYDR